MGGKPGVDHGPTSLPQEVVLHGQCQKIEKGKGGEAEGGGGDLPERNLGFRPDRLPPEPAQGWKRRL